jgi:esterase/lipase
MLLGTVDRVKHDDKRAARHPDTGILVGAEPRDLNAASRKTVLFVHGFSGTPNNFGDLPDRVAAAGWRARVMLLPGHGTSPFEFAQTTGDALQDAVLEELAQLRRDSERLVVLGHSMGGALATLAATENTVDGLILAAPFYAFTHRWYYLLPVERWVRLLYRAVPWVYSDPAKQTVKRRFSRGCRARLCPDRKPA